MSAERRRVDFELPERPKIARCASCDARMVWVAMPSGRRMPLDFDTRIQREGKWWAESHFATCPAASDHRRRLF